MKFNIKKFTNRFITLFTAVFVVVSFFCVSVSAVDVNGNEFIDPADYAIIDYVEDHTVTYEVNLPNSWYYTGVFRKPNFSTPIAGFSGSSFSFEYYGDSVDGTDGISLFIHPMGDELNVGTAEGAQLQNERIIDLSYFPKDLFFQYHILIDVYGSEVFSDADCYSYLLFVDKNGKVVKRQYFRFYPTFYEYGDTYIRCAYDFDVDFGGLDIPQEAVGLLPFCTLQNLTVSPDSEISISYSPIKFGFSMDALVYEGKQNEKLQATMKNVQKTLEEQGKTLEELQTGTPEQNQQAQEAIGSLNDSTDKLGALGDTMSSVDKPEIDSKQFSAESLVPSTSLTVLSAPFQALWENDTLLAMLTIVVALVLVSWIFFGKK